MATRKDSKNIAGLYDLEETLGKGHFAVVKAARHVFTNERVAVKVIDKLKLDTASSKAILKEVLCMKLVQHRNVVRLYEVIDTSSKLFLVLELGRGDLYDLIQRGELSEQQARRYFIQIFQAVSYCHKLHVVHRDLKPENVVFFPDKISPGGGGTVKLTDFGFSNNYRPGEKLDTSCGSLAYSAPEILLGDAYDAPAVDIWSLGVILYTLVTGHPPFQEANDSETLTMIMDVKYKIPPTVSMECADLIKKMLQRLPEKRISIFDIQQHGWVRGHEGEGDEEGETPLINKYKLTMGEREKIIQQMVDGGVVTGEEVVVDSLATNAYNYITSTYYLLAERLLRERSQTTNEEIKNLTSSLESLSSNQKIATNTRRASICDEEPPPPSHPPIPPTSSSPLPPSHSHSSGLTKLKFSPQQQISEEIEPETMETKKKPKSKKSTFFNWLFKRHSLTQNNNNNRIYKTRSCSELKIKFNVN